MYLGCFLVCFYFFPMVSQSDLFLNPYFLFSLSASYWSNFLIPDFFTQPACFSHSSYWSIFPILNLFYPTSHPQMRKFPNSSKILHKWFVLTNFCVIITTAINQIHKTSIKASENTLDKPVLHVCFIYEHIFICFHV